MPSTVADNGRLQEKTLTEKEFADSLFDFYTQNSFGAVSKRELDIFLFDRFKRLGKIGSTNSWDIAKELKISQTKARMLFYESSLRTAETSDETLQIKKVLDEPPIFKTNAKNGKLISLIVDNRYPRDAIRSYLRENGFFSDTSFASDVITMPIDAYIALLKKFQPDLADNVKLDRLKEAFKDLGIGVLSKLVGDSATNGLKSFFELIVAENAKIEH